jgi:hypothetical protein
MALGARGDGVTDDTAAIQRAIQAVHDGNDRTLYFPKGNYKITDTLDFSIWTEYYNPYSVDFGGATVTATGIADKPAMKFHATQMLRIGNGRVVAGGPTGVVAVADNGARLVRITTSEPHGYRNGDEVLIQGVAETAKANGYWRITGVDATHFDLQDSAFAGISGPGGFIVGRPVGILLDGDAQDAQEPKGIDVAIVEQLVVTGFHKNIQLGSGQDRRVAWVHFRAIATERGEYGITCEGLVDRCSFDAINTSTHGRRTTISGTTSGAAHNGGNLVRITTSGPHGYRNGDEVLIQGVAETAKANGYWTITGVETTHFDLEASAFTSDTGPGGFALLGCAFWLTNDVGCNTWHGCTGYGDYPLYIVDGPTEDHPCVSFGEQQVFNGHCENPNSSSDFLFQIWRSSTGNASGYASPWIFFGGSIQKCFFGAAPGVETTPDVYQTMFVGCGVLGEITVWFPKYYLRFIGCQATTTGNITVNGDGSGVYLDHCGPWAGKVHLCGVGSKLIPDETSLLPDAVDDCGQGLIRRVPRRPWRWLTE